MNTQDLSFLHFMVRVGSGRDRTLLSPMEAEEGNLGGTFVAPVRGDGRLFPAYRFHFSFYRGSGEFDQDQGHKALFDGAAVAIQIERKDHLLLTFEQPGPESWWPHHFWPRLPRVLRDQDGFYLPVFRRVPRRAPLRYEGNFRHRDFECKFVQLEPTEPKVLDEILDRFQISLIGCDPHTKYERR